MKYKTLHIGDDLREHITYDSHTIPLSICIDHFDEYLNREWECHWHEEFEFALLLSGQVTYSVFNEKDEKQVIELHPGDGIFINSGTLHSARASEADSVLAGFVFPLTFFEMKPFAELYRELIRPILESDIRHIAFSGQDNESISILSSMRELCGMSEEEPAYELYSLELICRIWRLLVLQYNRIKETSAESVAETPQAKRLKMMIQYIHENYGNDITSNDVSRSAGISRTECFRTFQALLNTTPTEYLISYRISMATMLLSNTTRSLADISQVCGFSTPSYFGRQFRSRCGVTPGEYRKSCRSN